MNMKQNIAILLAHLGQRQNEKINGLPSAGKGKMKIKQACPARAKAK